MQARDEAPPETYPGCDVVKEKPEVTAMLRQAFGSFTPTILDSIKAKCTNAKVIYAQGCDVAGNDRSRFGEAVAAAREADVVIVTMGGKYGWGTNCTIGEGLDRDDIGLTGIQDELAREIGEAGKPAVFVHMDARPLSSAFVKEHYNAIIENWFPGITGGQALADVLFGNYNPAGRLPVTAARNAGQIPIYNGQKVGNAYYGECIPGVLAKYVEGTRSPLFYFGEGLSYSTFEYSEMQVTKEVDAGGTVEISLTVKNTGEYDGDEVVQLYVVDETASMLRPAQEFAGCKRLFLKAGESKRVIFDLRAEQFAFIDKDMNWIVEAGEMCVKVGASSRDIRLTGSFNITNSSKIDATKRGFYAKATVRSDS
jgi:beta-glucosidase